MDYVVPEYGLGSIYGFEEMEAIARALQQGSYEGGQLLEDFERQFAEYCSVKHAIGTVSGTMALHLVADALRLTADDEVICTTQTFQATMLPFVARRVNVRLADIEADTLCIDPTKIEPLITPKTRAIYVMHYGGLPCEMDPILELARSKNLKVVEDAAHAAGAQYKGRRIGGLSDFTAFSFGSLKNMVTLGRGGMITTNDDQAADALRSLRGRGLWARRAKRAEAVIGPHRQPEPPYSDHSGDSYTHDCLEIMGAGMNVPMSGPEAACGIVQLRKLDHMNQIRRELAARYARGLCAIDGVRVQPVSEDRHSVYHLFPFFINQKQAGVNHDGLIRALEARGIKINNRFFPCHLAAYMRMAGHGPGECPVCERVWFEEQVNLPISPLHTPKQIDYVIETVADLVRELKR